MCGIAGIIGDFNVENVKIKNTILDMNAIQNHRGPDVMDIKCYHGAVLGHTRLSIIDLSEQAQQPMESIDGRYVIVYNGEIYNYLELKNILKANYQFKSNSDTEVLLAAYDLWKEDLLHKINGMFAFCIYDKVNHTAFFARDRFGQKPMFFAEVDNKLYFASEIKALLAARIKAQPDYQTWFHYLTTAQYDDSENTFFKDVKQLLPGECGIYKPGKKFKRRIYYDILNNIHSKITNEAEAIEKIYELLIDIGKIHMRSDVPVGVSLSGGLDSSALLAIFDMSNSLHNETQCISVDFSEYFSEEKWIKAAAVFHQLPYLIFNYTPNLFRESLQKMMWHQESPIGGLLNCAQADVMKEARKRGIKVIQDGCGVDEAFAGYQNFHNLYIGNLLKQNSVHAHQALSDYAKNWQMTIENAKNVGLAELEKTGTAIDGSKPTRLDLYNLSFLKEYNNISPNTAQEKSLLKLQSSYLQRTKIPRGVRMKDRISMAYGIELRCPFLDHRLIELAMGLPDELYFKSGYSKYILRKVLAGKMDESVRISHKRSVNAPQGIWLRIEPMKSYINELINSKKFKERGFFNHKKVIHAYNDFCISGAKNSFFVWQWINLEEWFRIFIDNNSVLNTNTLCPELNIISEQLH